jgi:hypothetical protein
MPHWKGMIKETAPKHIPKRDIVYVKAFIKYKFPYLLRKLPHIYAISSVDDVKIRKVCFSGVHKIVEVLQKLLSGERRRGEAVFIAVSAGGND